MGRRRLGLLIGIYVVIAILVGVAIGWIAAIVVAFLSTLVLAIGFGALLGGDWFRDASAGRFRDDGRG